MAKECIENLEKWIELLKIDGVDSKHTVANEMKKYLDTRELVDNDE